MIMKTLCTALLFILSSIAVAAETVPTDIQQPGTQPQEVGNLESPDKCDNCHGGYNTSVEPDFLGNARYRRTGFRWLWRSVHTLS